MPGEPSGLGPPCFEDIADAARRLRGRAVVTPLLRADALDRACGARVHVKAESLQLTGSFKFRGAYTAISRLDPAARRRGVVAFSSGNHAQAVAAAARLFACPATIVMPSDAPTVKLQHTRAWGAEIVLYDRARESREEIARELSESQDRPLILPFDHPNTIAGQGTVGNEIASQCRALGVRPDAVLVPVSGGGLIAGCALALAEKLPRTSVYAVEPEGFDDTRRSLEADTRVANDRLSGSICDALLVPTPGALTFAVNRALLAGGIAVPDAAVRDAMRMAFEHLKLVLEPGGAIALAALLQGAYDAKDQSVVVVASGGNVDGSSFRDVLAGG